MPNPADPRKLKQEQNAASILFAEEEDVDMDVDEVLPVAAIQQPSQTVAAIVHHLLLDRIITPSPFAQHNTGTSRFRTAFQRITADPVNDTEAWQAVITETSTCYNSVLDKASPEQYAKLDWVESCYGALIHHFPYAVHHIAGIAEILLQQCMAIATAPRHPLHTSAMAHRSQQCHAKLTHLFQTYLGVGQSEEDMDSIPLCIWVVELWLLYIKKVEHDAADSAQDPRAVREAVTAAYDLAVTAAGDSHNNHLLWRAYLEFVQSWTGADRSAVNVDHALAQRQMLQLRSVYQRAVVHPLQGLDQLWQEYESFEKQQSEALAAALIQDFAPKYQHARTVYLERNRVVTEDLQLGRLATPPVSHETENDDYHGKMMDEYKLLRLWKTRCSYERTNPGRFSSVDLSRRIRHTFCEMACTLTRHPETWHMWSTWELLHGSSAISDTSETDGLPQAAHKAVQVLQLGQEHIPDSTLLAFAEAQIVEGHSPAACSAVLEKFLARSPNTLGFVLYQQLVRRYQGKEQARAVFARARRTLAQAVVSKAKEEAVTETGEGDAEKVEGDAAKKKEEENGKRWMVTNRLDPSIGAATVSGTKNDNGDNAVFTESGPITWHLYAAHAIMEHRLNRAPGVAARVFELGLRKHASFLTVPPYIQRYAQLLLELNDIMNLRALLTRAVAACEAEDKRDALASLWDMTLHFESVGGADPASAAALQTIEKRRREALMGPDVEDVATGGVTGANDTALIGAQKSTIAEQLLRAEGYDVSSRIVNGMSRTVDLLGVMGLWGAGGYESRSRKAIASKEYAAEFSGGKSDASFQKRLEFQQMTQSGISPEAAIGEAGTGSKILSARERLAGVPSAGGPGGGTAIMLAIQQSADWLRPLLLLLPASQLRLPIVAKPPPHLTEMALSTLRQNALPVERPADDVPRKGSKRSLAATNDGNSSDEDDATGGTSGYGNTFRARQLARMEQNGSTHLN
jgi:Suppressor of forked protein (Suf)